MIPQSGEQIGKEEVLFKSDDTRHDTPNSTGRRASHAASVRPRTGAADCGKRCSATRPAALRRNVAPGKACSNYECAEGRPGYGLLGRWACWRPVRIFAAVQNASLFRFPCARAFCLAEGS